MAAMLTMDELIEAAPWPPRWPLNSRNIFAPEDICGDPACVCARRARKIMTRAEFELAFRVSYFDKRFTADER
jgi:hypothetical protein